MNRKAMAEETARQRRELRRAKRLRTERAVSEKRTSRSEAVRRRLLGADYHLYAIGGEAVAEGKRTEKGVEFDYHRPDQVGVDVVRRSVGGEIDTEWRFPARTLNPGDTFTLRMRTLDPEEPDGT